MKRYSPHVQTKVMQKYLTSTQKVLVAISLGMSFVAFAFAFTLLPNKNGEKPLCSYISCPRNFNASQQEKRVRAPIVKNPRTEQATLALYESYLNYPSMKEVAQSLESFQVSTTSNKLLPSRDLILRTLTGYNANDTTAQKKLFFEKTFSDIQFQYTKQEEYIMRVAHALWFEKNGGANWSLKDYSPDEIAILLWTPGYAGGMPNGTATNIPLLQYPQSFVEDAAYSSDSFRQEGMYSLHQLAMKFKKSTIKESLLAAIYWQKKNFFHAYTDYNWNVYKDNQTEADKIALTDGSAYLPTSMERLFDERVTGCHEHSLLISDYLRAMNIPAANINHVGHGVLFVPSLNAYVHGDHIADMHVMPPEDYLVTADQLVEAGQNIHAILQKKYPFPQHYFTNTQLARKDNKLFLHTDSVTGITIPQSDWDIMVSQVPEFNLKYDKATGISSDMVPIQTLEELSK